jgi:hypothetical protein
MTHHARRAGEHTAEADASPEVRFATVQSGPPVTDGEYQVYDYGTYDLPHGGISVWVAPLSRPALSTVAMPWGACLLAASSGRRAAPSSYPIRTPQPETSTHLHKSE